MPIYEYECSDCHHKFDLLQKINDEVVKTCPQCSKETAVRLVSAAGFQLKGSGWYATDFKDKGKPAPKSEHRSSSSETKSTESKAAESSTTSSAPQATTTSKGESD